MTTSPRLRVLQVLPALYHGGAENVAESLATAVDPARLEMLVCCTRGFGPVADRISAAGVPVMLAGPHERPNPYRSVWNLHQTIRRVAPDVVHTHGITSLSDVGTLAVFGRRPAWIHTFHYGNYPYSNWRHMVAERWLSRLPDRLVAVSDTQRAAIIAHHGMAPQRIVTILNGVRPNQYADDPEHRVRKRRELGLDADALVIGAVAVLSEQKGIPYLLRAVPAVVASVPNVKFVIVGGGPLEQACRDEAASLGIGDAVVFTGWRNDVAGILPIFDIWVMSSLWEAMPLALLEAMAAGLPIVATDVGDNRAITGMGSAAVVVPPRSERAIATAILRFLHEPAAARRLGAAARQRFESRYSVSHMVAAYAEMYMAAAAKRPVRERALVGANMGANR